MTTKKTEKEKIEILSFEIKKNLKDSSRAIAQTYGMTLSAFTRFLLSKSVNEHKRNNN